MYSVILSNQLEMVQLNSECEQQAVVHIYNGLLLGHKKNEILPFATAWMDLEGTTLSKIS